EVHRLRARERVRGVGPRPLVCDAVVAARDTIELVHRAPAEQARPGVPLEDVRIHVEGVARQLLHREPAVRQRDRAADPLRRRGRQEELDAGRLPDFLPETKEIRDRDWTVAPIRPDLTDRRVEITGPVERKMMINALNSGANVFMADFEDANAPTWENNVRGQQNVRDAVTRTIAYTSPEGKRYALEAKTATLVVRPRGWHLVEKHL